jgi:hypothetical protein
MRRAIGFVRFVTSAVVVAGLVAGSPRAEAQQLDLGKAEDALKANRKIHCSLTDGESVTMSWQGRVYSRVLGERDRLLFGVLGMNVRACTTVRDAGGGYGYHMVSREIMLYLDPATGQLLRKWKNPWTGKEVDVIHVANDPVNSRPQFAKGADGREFTFPGTVQDGMVSMAMEIPLFYTNPLAGDYQEYVGGLYHAMEIFQFFTSESDLRDATKPRVENLSIGWVRVAQWLPWMEMGSLSGQMIVAATGRSLKAWSDLPPLMKAEIQSTYPAYTTAPPADDARPNETSWTYFKKVLDARKKQAAPRQ